MSKRNFILLIIILVAIGIAVFVFLAFRPKEPSPTDTSGGTNFFSQFNPLGTKPPSGGTTPPIDVSGYVPPTTGVPTEKLIKVSSMPVAGFGLFSKERLKEINPSPTLPLSGEGEKTNTSTKKTAQPLTEFATAVRYVDRATGNIYQTFADKIQERKFSGTMIPKVHEAYFGNRAESVAMRYLKADGRTIETFVGNLPKELLGADTSVINEVKGSFLPNNVRDISLSLDTSKMFYLFSNGNDLEENLVGTILNFLNNKKSQIFDSPFTEWLSQWPSNNTITLTTKPSANISGYMYTIDSAGKNLIKILGDIKGLTTLTSPNGKLILYGDNNLLLNIYDTEKRNPTQLGIRTLPEKCVWGKISDAIFCAVPKQISVGSYPDTWYQGEMSFNDQIWKVDTKTGNAALLIDPSAGGREEIDGTKLALDESENYLFFVNKKDSFLWEFNLK